MIIAVMTLPYLLPQPRHPAPARGGTPGLDKNTREDAKKVAAASKILVAFWDTVRKNIEKDVKSLDVFDKHMADFNRFKPSAP